MTDPTHYALRVTAEPSAEPVSLGEAKAHCRLDGTDDDALVSAWLSAARGYVEDLTARTLVTTTFRLTLDRFPWQGCAAYPYGADGRTIVVPRVPLQSVSSITYVDTAGDTQTLAADQYRADSESEPGRITPAYGVSWPSTRVQTGAVTVTFVAGYLTPFTAVASTDVLTAAGRTYANGDIVRLMNSGGALPGGLAAATSYYVVQASGATFKLSATLAGSAIDVTDAGQGTHFVGSPSAGVTQNEGLRAAIKLLVGHWHENRETVVTGTISKEIELAVTSLLWQRRVFL